jgi:hypothetical protein
MIQMQSGCKDTAPVGFRMLLVPYVQPPHRPTEAARCLLRLYRDVLTIRAPARVSVIRSPAAEARCSGIATENHSVVLADIHVPSTVFKPIAVLCDDFPELLTKVGDCIDDDDQSIAGDDF